MDSCLELVPILGSTRGLSVCLRLLLRFSLYPLFQTRHSCFASRILEARNSYLQFSGSVPLRSLAQGTQPFVDPLASPEMVSSRPELGVLTNLCFRDQGHFKAGMLYESFPVWQRLLADYSCAVDLLEILRDGVRVDIFSPHLGGILRGVSTMRRPLLPTPTICNPFLPIERFSLSCVIVTPSPPIRV